MARTISLPGDLQSDVERIAAEKKVSQNRVIERALEHYVFSYDIERQQKRRITAFRLSDPHADSTADASIEIAVALRL